MVAVVDEEDRGCDVRPSSMPRMVERIARAPSLPRARARASTTGDEDSRGQQELGGVVVAGRALLRSLTWNIGD